MLLDNASLSAIAAGEITVVFRTWQRPTVKAGGSLRTRIGVLAIEAVDAVTAKTISARDVKQAGFASRAELLGTLQERVGTLYRIRLHVAGEDPRIALREKSLTRAELTELERRLARMDAASKTGAWTAQYLALIEANPARRAPDLASGLGLETLPFKQRVRRLKEFGLTESLTVGYRLSKRGISYLAALRKAGKAPLSAAGRRP
jgi:hypothetical protein